MAGADVVITTYGTAVRDIEALAEHDWDGVVLDEAQAIKNHTNETAQQLRRIDARTPPGPHRHPDRERPRRPVVDPRLHQPRPGRAGAPTSSPSSPARARPPCGAQRHPRVPPHEGRAERRRRAARPDRRARPLHDDPGADRPLPGGARRLVDPRPSAERAASRKQGAILAAITALKQICNHPGRTTRTTSARWPGGPASSPGSRRSSSRCSRPASAS